MSRFEQFIQNVPDVRDRLAIAAAIFMAVDNRAMFTKRAGTYGMECLDRLMQKGEDSEERLQHGSHNVPYSDFGGQDITAEQKAELDKEDMP